MKVAEGEGDLEMMITRHSQFQIPLNIINLYGEQECRSSREKILENWEKVLQAIDKIESKGELLILQGDLNKHLSIDVPGLKDSRVTYGGKLVDDLIATEKYVVINSSDKVINGPYTRYDPSAPDKDSKKSVLDIFIVSKDLSKFVEFLYIDKDKKYTPCNALSKRNIL